MGNKTMIPDFTPSSVILSAACLLILPLRWILFGFLAAAVHEAFHIAALKACSVHIYSIMVDVSGARIETEPMDNVKELICAAAGPAGSLMMLLFVRWAPLLSLFGLVQGLFNLLPIFPMDGGRILKASLNLTIPRYAEVVSRIVCLATSIILFLLILCGAYQLKLVRLAGMIGVFLFLRILVRKISCKDRLLRLQ